MCAERLHFEPGQMEYHAVSAAEHVGRYLFALPYCRGARVLDAACGEGYGSRLLARAGAAAVVGIDLSADAVRIARDRFGGEGITFLQADVTDLPRHLDGQPPFDLIVSYETLEHVADVRAYLEGLRRALAPGGVLIISCPNDAHERARGIENPFHLRVYSFDEFRAVTTGVLGPAAGWHLGTPLQGAVIAAVADERLSTDRTDMGLLLETGGAVASRMLPAQQAVQVNAANCSFYLGIWGAAGEAVQVTSPMSRVAFLEPWISLDWYKMELARLGTALEAREARIGSLESEIGGRDTQIGHLESEIGSRDTQIGRLEAEIGSREAQIGRRDAQIRFLEAQIESLRRASAAEKRRLKAAFHGNAAGLPAIALPSAIVGGRAMRAAQLYYSLYGLPVLGPLLRTLRRVARAAVRP